jgi:excinuclease ABC subunit A
MPTKTKQSEKTHFEDISSRDFIIIKGAKVNNLKNISLAIPRNKLIVVTGVSGSGKSSLAFDTLFAEGQRMYVESLSAYARQFLGRMEKPEVEYIRGISPAIAVEQKVNTRNPRSTVGTSTEIYDYLKLFFARVGKIYSPISGKEVRKNSISDVVDFIENYEVGAKYMILAPLILENRTLEDELKILLQKGFTRIKEGNTVLFIEEVLKTIPKSKKKQEYFILIDRNVVKENDEKNLSRIADSTQTAFFEGRGTCLLEIFPKDNKRSKKHYFSNLLEADGMSFEEPSVNFFSFNNPHGACKKCEGFGSILGVDMDLVVPDKSLSIYEGAIAPWRSEKMSKQWLQNLVEKGIEFDFPIHRAYEDLSESEKELLWTGNEYFGGLTAFFEDIQAQAHKIQYRVMYSRYRGRQVCPDCRGTRIRKDANYVKIGDTSISDLLLLPIKDLIVFFDKIKLDAYQKELAKRLLSEIKNRLKYLNQVGLGYLTLNRKTLTLSGGEFQRIKLATSLGSALVGSMYILDEPSIGLHPRDTQNLVEVLKVLRDLGNTVIVVEHEEELMRAADQIIDIGLDAGKFGGDLTFQGTLDKLIKSNKSYTAQYLSGKLEITIPKTRRKSSEFIQICGARENNLKNVDASFPLGVLTAVTGVSGSGKSTLVRKLLYPALSKALGEYNDQSGKMREIKGSIKKLTQIEMIDQNPIGKSSRSNPVTYIKAYDLIRTLFASQGLAEQRKFKAGAFSFNVEGGRCEACQGEGTVKIEMQFMADIYLTCENCKGKRFKDEVLDIKYKDKNIADILELSVDEAIDFFAGEVKIHSKILALQEVGLGYIKLGQSSNTLSGGEAQRVKLAYFLSKGKNKREKSHILFIFDEPTTGLHFHDISKLLKSINALVDRGHTAIIIEHNVEVIKCADWVIDLGKEGGDLGGNICFEGTPEAMIKLKDNHTAKYLKEKF